MIIRRAVEDDLSEILALYKELTGIYSDVNSEDPEAAKSRWQAVCADDRQHVLAAEVDGKIVGTLNLTIVPNLGHGGQPWAAIDNVVVSASQRGQGIGETLIAEAGKIAKARNCYKIILSSNLARTRAHDFYRRLGWKESHIGFSMEL